MKLKIFVVNKMIILINFIAYVLKCLSSICAQHLTKYLNLNVQVSLLSTLYLQIDLDLNFHHISSLLHVITVERMSTFRLNTAYVACLLFFHFIS